MTDDTLRRDLAALAAKMSDWDGDYVADDALHEVRALLAKHPASEGEPLRVALTKAFSVMIDIVSYPAAMSRIGPICRDRLDGAIESARRALAAPPASPEPASCLCSTWVGDANSKCPVHGSPEPAAVSPCLCTCTFGDDPDCFVHHPPKPAPEALSERIVGMLVDGGCSFPQNVSDAILRLLGDAQREAERRAFVNGFVWRVSIYNEPGCDNEERAKAEAIRAYPAPEGKTT